MNQPKAYLYSEDPLDSANGKWDYGLLKETFEKYAKNVKTEKSLDNNSLPWIRFPRTKDGVTIPLLMERIFTKIPKSIVFTK